MSAFTVCMENSLRFEISLRSIRPKLNLDWGEVRCARGHVSAGGEVTSHRGEILPRNEISSRFELTSGLM